MTTTHPLLKNPFSHNVFDWIALKMLGEKSYHACMHRSSEYFYHKGIFRKISLVLLFGLQFVMIAYMILSCHNMNVSSIVCVMLDQITHFAQFINRIPHYASSGITATWLLLFSLLQLTCFLIHWTGGSVLSSGWLYSPADEREKQVKSYYHAKSYAIMKCFIPLGLICPILGYIFWIISLSILPIFLACWHGEKID